MIRNIDCTTDNLLDYDYFSTHYKLIAIDLSKQDIDLRKQQIDFIGKLEQDATIFFIIEEKKQTILDFFRFLARIKMELQKILNLLESSDDDELKFQTKRWDIINDQIMDSMEKAMKMIAQLNLIQK